MDLAALLQLTPGANPVVVSSPSEAENALRAVDRATGESIEVRFLRGKKMRTKDGLLQECAAALQFPYYFGENWDALRDLLGMIPLLKHGSLIVCVWDAAEVLSESTPEDTETLRRVLEQLQVDLQRGHSRHALKWVWQTTAEQEPIVRKKWGNHPVVRNG